MDTATYFGCALDGDLDGLRRLLGQHPELLDARTSGEGAPRFPGQEQGVPGGATALHLAVYGNQVGAARLLLDAGIDVAATTHGGRSALHEAVELGHAELTQLLIERGARIDVCLAAILGRLDLLRELLDGDPELANDRSTELSPLGWAAYGNQPEAAGLLLDRGARMDDGELLCAASVGHVEVGRLLMDRGADPDEVHASCGASALHVGVGMQYTQDGLPFLRMLLERGVDTARPSARGETALDIARRLARQQAERLAAGQEDCPRPYDEVVALLEAHSPD